MIVTGLSIWLGFATIDAVATETSVPQAYSDGLEAIVTDTAITARVKTRLLGEDNLGNSSIRVTTTNGVVTLDGTASSREAANVAVADTSAVEGVKSVDNNLITPGSNKTIAKTKRIVSDSWITTKVKSLIFADNVSNGVDVSVATVHGVVVLKGALPDQNAIDHVKYLATQVNRVKSVDTTNLVIARQ
jgi:hyperosmotically inducible protein